jgi:hypothetical protein
VSLRAISRVPTSRVAQQRGAGVLQQSLVAEAPQNQVADTIALVKAYVQQETLEPVQGAGRFLKIGAPGALLLGLGTILLTMATIRLVQAEGPEWMDGSGTSSFVPYICGLIFCLIVIGLTILIGMRRSSVQHKEQVK